MNNEVFLILSILEHLANLEYRKIIGGNRLYKKN
jgi:hypothetical protein